MQLVKQILIELNVDEQAIERRVRVVYRDFPP